MPNAAAGAAAGGGMSAAAGGNPFQLVTNLYCEKNVQGVQTAVQLGATSTVQGGAVNSGQYLRAVRLVVRTATAGTSGTVASTSDMPMNIITGADLVNVDGSEILYVMGGWAHSIAQKYSRPWLGDPFTYPDAANSTVLSPQFTLSLMPEIRWTAGVLANTDTRSQYRFDYSLDTVSNIAQGGSGWATAPFVTVQPYMDAWAQPDDRDLQGTPNQAIPPGLNLQVKRRHQIITMNAATSDNILQSALTGNALRCQTWVTRTGASLTRSELFTDPIQWSIDNRSLGKFSVQLGTTQGATGDMVSLRMFEFYNKYFPVKAAQGATGGPVSTSYAPFFRETGVYVFPTFLQPGDLYGEGWRFTANSTKEIFETSTSSNFSTSATAELITDEVYPVGPVDPSLTDI